MELKWSQNDIKIDQKTMSKKHRKNDGQKSQHRANLAPKSLPKMATLFWLNVQNGGPRPIQDPSKSPRASSMPPRPSQNPPKTPSRPNFDQKFNQKWTKNRPNNDQKSANNQPTSIKMMCWNGPKTMPVPGRSQGDRVFEKLTQLRNYLIDFG